MNTLRRMTGLAVLLCGIGIVNTQADEPEYVPDEVLVKYEDGVSDERIGEIEEEFGLTLIRQGAVISGACRYRRRIHCGSRCRCRTRDCHVRPTGRLRS